MAEFRDYLVLEKPPYSVTSADHGLLLEVEKAVKRIHAFLATNQQILGTSKVL